ncbi:MAG TPA: SDR family NAD(P)-dependent oxidoreductase [Kofleriaceae bacterium]|nr:SDR family NAD(P)-dependent oxidoreductase [Kofleriaceae bacterium]
MNLVRRAPPTMHHDLGGKVAVVTGATSGIGKEAAWELARMGARVTLVGRTRDKAKAALEELVERGATREKLAYAAADLGRTGAVRGLADELASLHPKLDILLNNAGCYPAARVMTPDDFEESWATNTLAYEILTSRLHPNVAAAGGRIVYVGSTQAGDLDETDLAWGRRRWNGVRAYRQTKQANRMLAWAWARRLEGSGATINVAHPGGVNTNIPGRQPGLYGALAKVVFATQRTPAHGADVLVWLCASPELEGKSGGFYKDRRELECAWKADVEASERLWELCQRQIKAPIKEPTKEPSA